MEISSNNQAQLAQFQRVQNQENTALNTSEEVQATPQNSTQNQTQNSSVNISQEARERLATEQNNSSATNETVELQSTGSTAEKPR